MSTDGRNDGRKDGRLQVMATISGKFHKNPLKTVGGVAETRIFVDKMTKTDKGPLLW